MDEYVPRCLCCGQPLTTLIDVLRSYCRRCWWWLCSILAGALHGLRQALDILAAEAKGDLLLGPTGLEDGLQFAALAQSVERRATDSEEQEHLIRCEHVASWSCHG